MLPRSKRESASFLGKALPSGWQSLTETKQTAVKVNHERMHACIHKYDHAHMHTLCIYLGNSHAGMMLLPTCVAKHILPVLFSRECVLFTSKTIPCFEKRIRSSKRWNTIACLKFGVCPPYSEHNLLVTGEAHLFVWSVECVIPTLNTIACHQWRVCLPNRRKCILQPGVDEAVSLS